MGTVLLRPNYLQMYIYRLKKRHRKEFLEIEQKASKIYRKYGAGEEETYLLHDGRPRYGLRGMSSLLPAKKDEEIWIGITRYMSAKHCRQVMAQVNKDPKIDPLFQRALRILHPASRHVRAEFEKKTRK